MANLAEILQKLSYYKAGGGRKQPDIGDVLSTLGGSLNQAGEGLSKAVAPTLSDRDTKRKLIGQLLDNALKTNTMTGRQVNQVVGTGQLDPNMVIGKSDVATGSNDLLTPDQLAKLIDPKTGKHPPMGTTKSQAAGFTPINDSLNALNEERAKRAEERRRAVQTEFVNKFNNSPTVKPILSSLSAYETIRSAAEGDNPIAQGALPTLIVKAIGDVGAISESDKAPFGGSRALQNRIKQVFQTAATGTLEPENKQFILDFASMMEKNFKKRLDIEANRLSGQYSKVKGNPKQKELYDMFMSEYDFGDTSKDTSKEDAEAVAWAKANPKDPRAVKILQANGVK